MSIDEEFLKDTVKYNGTSDNRPDPVSLPDGSEKIHIGSGYVTSLLGEGGMSRVYEIWNNRLEIFRAVKLLQPNSNDETKQRFQTEMKITAKLHHPNIIEIHEVGEWNNVPYIEMERVKGFSLDRIIEDRGALDMDVCTSVAILVGNALKYAHSQKYSIYGNTYQGVIHRDLKPANIMITTDGSLKLMDFGIARPAEASLHTTDGSILGTLQYLSPEQIEGKRIDARSDIYSLGCTLYEIVTGVQTFPEKNISKLMMQKINGEFKPLNSYNYKIPKRLNRLINRCLAHNPDARIQNAETFLYEARKTHQLITNASPNAVLNKMINSKIRIKTILSEKKTLPVLPAVLTVLLLIISVSAVWGYFWYINYRESGIEQASEEVYQIPEEKEPEKGEKRSNDKEISDIKDKKDKVKASVYKKVVVDKDVKRKDEQKTFLQKMLEKYSSQNPGALHIKLVRMKKFSEAAGLYDHLPVKTKKNTGNILFHMRALWNLGRIDQLLEFVSENRVDDAEYYLIKAGCLYRQNNTEKALETLESAVKSESGFMDPQELKLDILYYKALCFTRLFEKEVNQENYKRSLDGWWSLKNQLRQNPNSAYMKKAREATQHIARLYRQKKS